MGSRQAEAIDLKGLDATEDRCSCRAATAELVQADLPGGVGLRDLGRHRLKDLGRPERIHQLTIYDLPSEFPAIRSLETPRNLSIQRTSFVDREEEVARVKQPARTLRRVVCET
jgi:hypothetical protein